MNNIPLILRTPEEKTWLDAHGDKKMEIYKEFGSEVTIDEPRDVDALLLLLPTVKAYLAKDLARQANMAIGITADVPLALHVRLLGRRGGMKHSWGSERPFVKGDTLETAFNELTYELPLVFRERLRRPTLRCIADKGSVQIRVMFALIYDQSTIKAQLMKTNAAHRPLSLVQRGEPNGSEN